VLLNIGFNREGLLAPCPTPKLEDHPSSAVRDFLFKLFAAMKIGGMFFRILMLTKFSTPFIVLTFGYLSLVSQSEKNLKLLNPNHGSQLVLKFPALIKENYFSFTDVVKILDINPIIKNIVKSYHQ